MKKEIKLTNKKAKIEKTGRTFAGKFKKSAANFGRKNKNSKNFTPKNFKDDSNSNRKIERVLEILKKIKLQDKKFFRKGEEKSLVNWYKKEKSGNKKIKNHYKKFHKIEFSGGKSDQEKSEIVKNSILFSSSLKRITKYSQQKEKNFHL